MADDGEQHGGAGDEAALRRLLDDLRRTRGVDLSAYKEGTLGRRIHRRRQEVGAEDLDAYRRYLEDHPDELPTLFDTILINVTSFFRDTETWKHLAEKVLPDLLASVPPDRNIRVWTAGCSSGEEPYTILMLLAEALGPAETKARMQVYATDIDDDALARARSATYTAEDLEPVPSALRGRYFSEQDGRFVFRQDLRGLVVFGHHDLLHDPPMSRIDLLVCRNTLMYFTPDAQGSVLRRFHFSLNPDGLLLLGRAEMLLTQGDLFTPVHPRQRVFRKAADVAEGGQRPRLIDPIRRPAPPERQPELGEAAFDLSPVPQLVIDRDGSLALANQAALETFGLAPRDVGRAFSELRLSYRPAELRSAIDQAYAEEEPVSLSDVDFTVTPGDVRLLRIQVDPLIGPEGARGAVVTFEDVTEVRRADQDLQRLRREREAAYEELQASNEELETMNEELQASNEELETTNEELQSTNEELETMNEELQSTNTELEAINQELQERTTAHDRVNTFLQGILAGLTVGVIVLDEAERVVLWNRHAEDQWGVRSEEVAGHHLADVDVNLPVDDLLPRLRSILSGELAEHQDTVETTNRRGRAISCRLAATPLARDGEPVGVILWMEDTPR